eukprot:1670807-Rhodomonas_salina.3
MSGWKESQCPLELAVCTRLPSLIQPFPQMPGLFWCTPETVTADVSPGRARLLPSTPELHSDSSGPAYPAGQMQSVTFVLPAFEIKFAGHARQADAFNPPATGAYVPAGHSTHDPALPTPSRYLPAGHTPQKPSTSMPGNNVRLVASAQDTGGG